MEACLQDQLSTRENALQAVREGSAAETSMALAARREAEGRAAAAEAAAEQLQQDLAQAEDRVAAALQEGRRQQEAAQQRSVLGFRHQGFRVKCKHTSAALNSSPRMCPWCRSNPNIQSQEL